MYVYANEMISKLIMKLHIVNLVLYIITYYRMKNALKQAIQLFLYINLPFYHDV